MIESAPKGQGLVDDGMSTTINLKDSRGTLTVSLGSPDSDYAIPFLQLPYTAMNMYIRIYIYICVCTYIYVYIHIYVCVFIHAYIYVYIYMHIFSLHCIHVHCVSRSTGSI